MFEVTSKDFNPKWHRMIFPKKSRGFNLRSKLHKVMFLLKLKIETLKLEQKVTSDNRFFRDSSVVVSKT